VLRVLPGRLRDGLYTGRMPTPLGQFYPTLAPNLRRALPAVVSLLTTLGCGADSSVNETSVGATEDSTDGDGATTDQPTTSGDGDGDPGPDPDPACDVATLPEFEPIWIMPSPVEPDGQLQVTSLALSEDAVFSRGRFSPADSPTTPGFIERRDLDGNRVWLVDDIATSGLLKTDGAHVVYRTSASTLERVTVDGVADDWSMPLPTLGSADSYFTDLELGPGDDMLLVGELQTDPNNTQPTDGLVSWHDKDGTLLDTFVYGLQNSSEVARVAGFSSTTGFWAVYEQPLGLALRSYAGAPDLDLDLRGPVSPSFLHEWGDGVLLGGTSNNQAWLSEIDASGQVWERTTELCQGGTQRAQLAFADERIWGLLDYHFVTGDEVTRVRLLFRLDLQGELMDRFRVAGTEPNSMPHALVSNGDAVVVAGGFDDPAGTWLARLR
jgi:hypothetical protein